MRIAFVHKHQAFLPDIEAYCRFFSAYGTDCRVITPDELGLTHRDVEWFFMGSDFTKPREGIIKIHEYASSSTPPMRQWKNFLKSYFNAQPDFRLFLNEYVKSTFQFRDRVPFGFRNMGIDPSWLAGNNSEKEFDFIYTGDLSMKRQPRLLLDCFSTGNMQGRSILLLSRDYEELRSIYQPYSNIQFQGPVTNNEVAQFIRKSRFAINFIPDLLPYSRQTSTKLLEYAACSVPIISSDNNWVRVFQQKFGGNYFFLNHDLSNFNWESINNFPFAFPDLSDWHWEQQIRGSGILEFLSSKFPVVQFDQQQNA